MPPQAFSNIFCLSFSIIFVFLVKSLPDSCFLISLIAKTLEWASCFCADSTWRNCYKSQHNDIKMVMCSVCFFVSNTCRCTQSNNYLRASEVVIHHFPAASPHYHSLLLSYYYIFFSKYTQQIFIDCIHPPIPSPPPAHSQH